MCLKEHEVRPKGRKPTRKSTLSTSQIMRKQKENRAADQFFSILLDGEHELLVLDVMLPGGSGLELLKTVRASSKVPVILLSAMGEAVDRIIGLQIGADDPHLIPSSLLAQSWIWDGGMRHNLPLPFYSFYHHKVIALGNMMRKIFVVHPGVVAKVSGAFRV